MEYQNDQPAEQGYDGTNLVGISQTAIASSALISGSTQVNVTTPRETAVAAQDRSTATMVMTEFATVT